MQGGGLDSITLEHLKNSHPAVFVLLSNLFNFIAANGLLLMILVVDSSMRMTLELDKLREYTSVYTLKLLTT